VGDVAVRTAGDLKAQWRPAGGLDAAQNLVQALVISRVLVKGDDADANRIAIWSGFALVGLAGASACGHKRRDGAAKPKAGSKRVMHQGTAGVVAVIIAENGESGMRSGRNRFLRDAWSWILFLFRSGRALRGGFDTKMLDAARLARWHGGERLFSARGRKRMQGVNAQIFGAV
jgi:hypothetical protein